MSVSLLVCLQPISKTNDPKVFHTWYRERLYDILLAQMRDTNGIYSFRKQLKTHLLVEAAVHSNC